MPTGAMRDQSLAVSPMHIPVFTDGQLSPDLLISSCRCTLRVTCPRFAGRPERRTSRSEVAAHAQDQGHNDFVNG